VIVRREGAPHARRVQKVLFDEKYNIIQRLNCRGLRFGVFAANFAGLISKLDSPDVDQNKSSSTRTHSSGFQNFRMMRPKDM